MMLNHRQKHAQTTLFVVFAIIIVAVIGIYLTFRPEITRVTLGKEGSEKLLASQVAPVKEYVKQCVESSALKSINTLGRQGGRIVQKGEHFSVPAGLISDPAPIDYAYYYDKEAKQPINDLPTINEMKEQISDYLEADTEISECLKLSPFKSKFDVETGALVIDTEKMSLGDINGKIIIPFSYPVTLSLGDVKTSVDDYTSTIPINLGKIREAANRVVNAFATGKSITEIQVEYAAIQSVELEKNANADKIFIPESSSFDFVPSDSNLYNTKNNLITITYENPALTKPFIFYVLIGSEIE